jgi:gluconolactonase
MTRYSIGLMLFVLLFQTAPGFEVIDQGAFDELFPKGATVRKLAGGMTFTEGPAWVADASGDYLVFSDVPANEMKRWDPVGGVRTFRAPSGSANGNALDPEGRLITAEHAGRISRTEKNGTVITVVDSFDGKRLSSPNDVIVSRAGTIWFTDPPYGLAGRKQETPGNYVYRFDPNTKRVTAVVTDMADPNGLCLSPDESTLYVANSA